MRKSAGSALTTLAVLAIVVGAAWALVSSQLTGPPDGTVSSQEARPADIGAAIAVPDSALGMTVAHVHDGDTLFLTTSTGTELKVRLIGVDTPELQPAAECYALEARDHLRQLAPDGSTVRVVADAESQDQYGRSLFYLWTEAGEFVNLRLVADGFGTALNVEPNSAFWGELVDAERSAQESGAGLWSGC
ncbi:MAG: thermonuclease family protein [Homoserinimonas sp.]